VMWFGAKCAGRSTPSQEVRIFLLVLLYSIRGDPYIGRITTE
jgi:hypothetical protein